MRSKLNGWLMVLAVLLLAGCSGANEEAGSDATEAGVGQGDLVLYFQESEPGIEPYSVRMLITPGYIRIDDGYDESGFVLYDRASRTIYSVTHENRQILKIDYRPVEIEPPRELVLSHNESSDPQAPTIEGKAPVQYQLQTNGQTCHELVVVPGLLDEARTALIEYHEALAGEQAANLFKTPPEYQSDCMLSGLVFSPSRYLDFGFPIQERTHDGYMRALVNYERGVELSPDLFVLPEYSQYSINPDPVEGSVENGAETMPDGEAS